MSATPQTDVTTHGESWVHFSVLGGNTQQFEHEDGMTVGDLLLQAELERTPSTMVQVNGEAVGDDHVIEANSTVQVTGKVVNG